MKKKTKSKYICKHNRIHERQSTPQYLESKLFLPKTYGSSCLIQEDHGINFFFKTITELIMTQSHPNQDNAFYDKTHTLIGDVAFSFPKRESPRTVGPFMPQKGLKRDFIGLF